MSELPIRVVKVGGSLFALPDLGRRIQQWLSGQSSAQNVLIAGGGKLVDEVRRWHKLRFLDEVAAHWLAVDLMNITAELLHNVLPDVPLAEFDQLAAEGLQHPGATILAPANWLRECEPQLPGERLPQSWATTSDAIAGRLAIALEAEQLVLLKSSSAPSNDIEKLAIVGYVDAMLPRLCPSPGRLRFVNLREAVHSEVIL